MPAVSVIIPNYNHADYLAERIDSILGQTFQDIELIILDDRSKDDSKRVIEKYRPNEKVKHIIYNEINSGSPFLQWNKGAVLATGKYIWIAESDDVADKDLLATLVPQLENNENIGVTFCQSYKIDSTSEIIGDWRMHTEDMDKEMFAEDFVMAGNDFIDRFLLFKNVIPNASGVVFKKETFMRVGMANARIKFCADWLVWLKMLSISDVFYCSTMLNYFRTHQNSVIATTNMTTDGIYGYEYIIEVRKNYDAYLSSLHSIKKEAIVRNNSDMLSREALGAAFFYANKNKLHKALHLFKIGSKFSRSNIKYFKAALFYPIKRIMKNGQLP